jgi:predicted  nucleic acid-binding Zn-ribbon protein
MPHQCTACGHTFPDGSKEMLSGCPDCGGNKFQFMPASAAGSNPPADPGQTPDGSDATPGVSDGTPGTATDAPDPPGGAAGAAGAESSAQSPAGASVGDDSTENDSTENRAQVDARSETASEDEFAAHERSSTEAAPADASSSDSSAASPSVEEHSSGGPPAETPAREELRPPGEGRVADTPSGQRDESGEEGDLDALRAELDDQFESIKILEPGQYELNLMELYNRDEYIIALQEDGQYVIEVPESWIG